jgi:hypothetical protein
MVGGVRPQVRDVIAAGHRGKPTAGGVSGQDEIRRQRALVTGVVRADVQPRLVAAY